MKRHGGSVKKEEGGGGGNMMGTVEMEGVREARWKGG